MCHVAGTSSAIFSFQTSLRRLVVPDNLSWIGPIYQEFASSGKGNYFIPLFRVFVIQEILLYMLVYEVSVCLTRSL